MIDGEQLPLLSSDRPITGDRIKQARELRGWTQGELARLLELDQPTIAKIEAGRLQMRAETLASLAMVTGFLPSFFRQPPSPDFPLGSSLFRARASATAQEKARAHRYAQTSFDLANLLELRVRGPSIRIPRLVETPEMCARVARAEIGLSPDKPVPHLIRAIERAGVLVIGLPTELDRVDAFSLWAGAAFERPVMVVSDYRTGDRLRFSIAHELGHLVMHQSLRGNLATVEEDANRFARELLLPEEAMRDEMGAQVHLTQLAALKPRWGVSIQALIRRAYSLGIASERQYRYLNEQVARNGWKKREPENLDVAIERPRAILQMVEMLYGNPIDYRRLSADSQVGQSLLKSILQPFDGKQDTPVLTGAVRRLTTTGSSTSTDSGDEL